MQPPIQGLNDQQRKKNRHNSVLSREGSQVERGEKGEIITGITKNAEPVSNHQFRVYTVSSLAHFLVLSREGSQLERGEKGEIITGITRNAVPVSNHQSGSTRSATKETSTFPSLESCLKWRGENKERS
jgi:hypothetical protein